MSSTNMSPMQRLFDFLKKNSFNIQIFSCFILMLLVELKCLTKLHIFYFTLFPVAIIIGDFIEWFIRIKYLQNKDIYKIQYFYKKNIKLSYDIQIVIKRFIEIVCISATKYAYYEQTFTDFEGWELLVKEHINECPCKHLYK